MTVINCQISAVDYCECALAPMTSDCCLCHAHTTDSETEASRPPVPNCGKIYHPNYDGQTWHLLFSSRNWKRTCLDSVLAETAARSHFLFFHALYKYSTYVCSYVCIYNVSYELNLFSFSSKANGTWWKCSFFGCWCTLWRDIFWLFFFEFFVSSWSMRPRLSNKALLWQFLVNDVLSQAFFTARAMLALQALY